MTYTAKTAKQFRMEKGSLSDKIASELSNIATEITRTNSQFCVLTHGVGTNTALATAGIDLASGSDIQIYGVFFAPVACTVVKLHYYLTEAYVKESTTDAKIEVYDDTGTPAKIFGKTLTAAGEAAKYHGEILPESGKANLAAGARLDLKAVNTGSSSGTGHAIVILEYVET